MEAVASAAASAADGAVAAPPVGAPRKARGFSHSILKLARSRWGKVHAAVSSIFKAMALAKNDMQAFKDDSKQALQQAQLGISQVKLQVNNAEELSKINYMQQGNAELSTDKMIKARHDLRHDASVIQAVREWWSWLPTQGGSQSGLSHISKPVYEAMVVLIQLVLLPRFKMEPDPDYDPEEDWLDDNKGKEVMDFPDFFDAMFELADMWCDVVSGSAYTELLNGLLKDAKASGLMDKLLKRFGWSLPTASTAPAPAKPAPTPSPPTPTPPPSTAALPHPPTPDAPPPSTSTRPPAPAPAPAAAPAPGPRSLQQKLDPGNGAPPASPRQPSQRKPSVKASEDTRTVSTAAAVEANTGPAPSPPSPAAPPAVPASLPGTPSPAPAPTVTPARPPPAAAAAPHSPKEPPKRTSPSAPHHPKDQPRKSPGAAHHPPPPQAEPRASRTRPEVSLPASHYHAPVSSLTPLPPPQHSVVVRPNEQLPGTFHYPSNHKGPVFALDSGHPSLPPAHSTGIGVVGFDAPDKSKNVTVWHHDYMRSLLEKKFGPGSKEVEQMLQELSGSGRSPAAAEAPPPRQGQGRRLKPPADSPPPQPLPQPLLSSSASEYWDASASQELPTLLSPSELNSSTAGRNGRRPPGTLSAPATPTPSAGNARLGGFQMTFEKPSVSQQGYYAGPLGMFQSTSRSQAAGPAQQQQERVQQWRDTSPLRDTRALPHSKYPNTNALHRRPSSPHVAAPFKLSSPALQRSRNRQPPQSWAQQQQQQQQLQQPPHQQEQQQQQLPAINLAVKTK